MSPYVGISLMPEPDFIKSALPLFQQQEIDILEWSFDVIPPGENEPEWMSLLLNDFSDQNRLIGHGVRYSLLSATWEEKQSIWLRQLAAAVKRYNYRYITEHFGFMSSDNFHKGAPLPVPLNQISLRIGRDRLKRLQATAQIPVGIENLAFAFNEKQLKEQGEFLEKLIEPVNGFLILDLHNVWCQAVNFDCDPMSIVLAHPLSKVREIHVSGGSWSGSQYTARKKKIRRDTHDEAVPGEIFKLLENVLPLCPNVEAVIFERLGNTLPSENDKLQFLTDFKTVKKTVRSFSLDSKSSHENFESKTPVSFLKTKPLEDNELKYQQNLIVQVLSENADPAKAIESLKKEIMLGKNNWEPGEWNDYMVETAMELMRKWN
jgi:uncharacterized protein (UPF0276 family)